MMVVINKKLVDAMDYVEILEVVPNSRYGLYKYGRWLESNCKNGVKQCGKNVFVSEAWLLWWLGVVGW